MPWEFPSQEDNHRDAHQMWIFAVLCKILYATCENSCFSLLRTNSEYYQFSFKMFALGQQDGGVGSCLLTSPHRNSNWCSHPWTKVPVWELHVPGKRLWNTNGAAERAALRRHTSGNRLVFIQAKAQNHKTIIFLPGLYPVISWEGRFTDHGLGYRPRNSLM